MRSIARDFAGRAVATATAAAVSVALMAGSAAPARASSDDLIRFLLGATAVAIIVHSFSRSGSQAGQGIYPQHVLPAHCREVLRVSRRDIQVYNASCLTAAGLRNLPGRCHEVVRTNHGPRSIYRGTCMERAGYTQEGGRTHGAPHRGYIPKAVLPSHCEVRYIQRGVHSYGYDSTCLMRAGLRDLPRHCALSAGRGRDRFTLYEADCLYRSGYHRY